MNRHEHIGVTIMEECAELAQRVSKALRFGMHEVQPGQPDDNHARVMQEFADLIGMMELAGFPLPGRDGIEAKQRKFEDVLRFSGTCGTLTGDGPGIPDFSVVTLPERRQDAKDDTTPEGIRPETDAIIAFLNALLVVDREAISALMWHRVGCNALLGLHATVQVRKDEPSASLTVSILGLLNGYCGTISGGPFDGWGPISAVIDGTLFERFIRTETRLDSPEPV